MSKIQVLDQITIDKIAAGEVIERPASVVKELAENAIDAGATAVTVEIKEGGITFMRIADNGIGIDKEDVRAAFLRHSTSKIRSAEDLAHISSLGFRGEALSSIAAVSQVELLTKTKEAEFGVRYKISGGKEESLEDAGAPDGTTFLIRQLFYNTPARRKFLKTAMTEASHVGDLVTRLALSHPEVSFRFINNGQVKLHTSGNGNLKDVIYHIYGREIASNLIEVDFERKGIHITGYLGKPLISRGNRNFENYFVDGRYIKSSIISKAIEDGSFLENASLKNAMENCKEKGSALHLMGLLSPGGVHSHIEHLYGLLEMAKKNGIEKVYVHAFLDGRDVPPSSAAEYMQEACDKMNEIGVGKVATVMGRFYAMDRDNAWDRVEKAYDAMVLGEGVEGTCPVQAIKDSYANGVTDEFMLPTVCDKEGMIKADDSVIFFNFRPDRAREITRAFCADDFDGFDRGERIKTTFVCFTEYDATIENKQVAFVKEEITNTFGEFLAKNGKKQARIAETEKYAHVTFFFNGGVEEPNEGEDRILVKSPKVATYDLTRDECI